MKQPFSRFVLSILLLTSTIQSLFATPIPVLEAEVNSALVKFTKEVKGAEAFLAKSKGYIVFPSVIKGGFVVGGEYGEGALRMNGVTQHYYSMTSGSIGLQAGIQQRSVIIVFASQTALDGFMQSNGWEAGVDGSIAVVTWGAGSDLSSLSYEKPIYAFVFGAKGLMYNLTFEGTKFSKIIPK